MKLVDKLAIAWRKSSPCIYAVERFTGEIKPLSLYEYGKIQRTGLLDGYLVRLEAQAANALAAKIRANPLN